MFDCEGNVDQKGGNVDQKGSPLDVIALLLEIKLCYGVTRELLMLIFYHRSVVVYFWQKNSINVPQEKFYCIFLKQWRY